VIKRSRSSRQAADSALTILIAERDPFMRDTLARSLGDRYQVEFVTSGQELVETARRHPPDLIILEILLPEKDGLQVCRELRKEARLAGVPVLVFSMLEMQDRALQAGATAFLKKPLRKSQMLLTIEQLLSGESATNGKVP
jgi:CheY-like chemotaxis protein